MLCTTSTLDALAQEQLCASRAAAALLPARAFYETQCWKKAVLPKELFPTAATSLLPHVAREILRSSSCIKEDSRISRYPQSLSDLMTAKTSVGFAEELGCSFLRL